MIGRRALLAGAAGVLASQAIARIGAAATGPAPVLYVSHGAPLFATNDATRIAELTAWGKRLARPTAIVVMTPHFARERIALGRTGPGVALRNLPPMFAAKIPPAMSYTTPPSTELARRVGALLGDPIASDARPGFDHTTWMPLACLFPAADVPVLEVAWPFATDAGALALGRKLAPLRDEGALFVGSGGMTHNLAALDLSSNASVPSWSREFDAWAAERLAALDVDALVDWRHRAPAAELAHPDDGAHYRMLLVALGVAIGRSTAVTFPVTGFEAALSKRCVELA
jgi:4,5-DOPA dioxygenase extradiol